MNWTQQAAGTVATTALSGTSLALWIVRFANLVGVGMTVASALRYYFPAGNRIAITVTVDRVHRETVRWRVSTSNLSIPYITAERIDMRLNLRTTWSTRDTRPGIGNDWTILGTHDSHTIVRSDGRVPQGWGSNTPTNVRNIHRIRFDFSMPTAGGSHPDHFTGGSSFGSIDMVLD